MLRDISGYRSIIINGGLGDDAEKSKISMSEAPAGRGAPSLQGGPTDGGAAGRRRRGRIIFLRGGIVRGKSLLLLLLLIRRVLLQERRTDTPGQNTAGSEAAPFTAIQLLKLRMLQKVETMRRRERVPGVQLRRGRHAR